ncbi:hypothetical protein [endosymbiont 'TC1' of Trimyema compressum]|uniref:hypothetical protein n=1 Tax=endosymbiont 'TC1' of Trimyema compressum TaxID=243899 RepID=UPI001392478A|nr:hypothetical protein [endosymbiont 'TC1' of Trimyema compressum]
MFHFFLSTFLVYVQTDLEAAVNNATSDVEVVLGDNFPENLINTANFNISHNFNVVVS